MICRMTRKDRCDTQCHTALRREASKLAAMASVRRRWLIGGDEAVGMLMSSSLKNTNASRFRSFYALFPDESLEDRERMLKVLCRREAFEGNPEAINNLGWMTLFGVGEHWPQMGEERMPPNNERAPDADPAVWAWGGHNDEPDDGSAGHVQNALGDFRDLNLRRYWSPFNPAFTLCLARPLFELAAQLGSVMGANNLAVCDATMSDNAAGDSVVNRLAEEHPNHPVLQFNACVVRGRRAECDPTNTVGAIAKITAQWKALSATRLFQWRPLRWRLSMAFLDTVNNTKVVENTREEEWENAYGLDSAKRQRSQRHKDIRLLTRQGRGVRRRDMQTRRVRRARARVEVGSGWHTDVPPPFAPAIIWMVRKWPRLLTTDQASANEFFFFHCCRDELFEHSGIEGPDLMATMKGSMGLRWWPPNLGCLWRAVDLGVSNALSELATLLWDGADDVEYKWFPAWSDIDKATARLSSVHLHARALQFDHNIACSARQYWQHVAELNRQFDLALPQLGSRELLVMIMRGFMGAGYEYMAAVFRALEALQNPYEFSSGPCGRSPPSPFDFRMVSCRTAYQFILPQIRSTLPRFVSRTHMQSVILSMLRSRPKHCATIYKSLQTQQSKAMMMYTGLAHIEEISLAGLQRHPLRAVELFANARRECAPILESLANPQRSASCCACGATSSNSC